MKNGKTDYNAAMLNKLGEYGVEKPKILLHCCCAPCACYPVELLSEYADLTLFYCNPNITDSGEYALRLNELFKLGDIKGLEAIDFGFDGERFLRVAAERKEDREGGAACSMCIGDRLRLTAEYAERNGYDLFATTLTVSPLKNAAAINEIGNRFERYLPSDFKKRDGYKRGTELSNAYGFYRQNFCGCEFSRVEARERQTSGKTSQK